MSSAPDWFQDWSDAMDLRLRKLERQSKARDREPAGDGSGGAQAGGARGPSREDVEKVTRELVEERMDALLEEFEREHGPIDGDDDDADDDDADDDDADDSDADNDAGADADDKDQDGAADAKRRGRHRPSPPPDDSDEPPPDRKPAEPEHFLDKPLSRLFG